jgi:endonuclease YncB( thermonuclease family)
MPQPEALDLAAVDERLEVSLRDGRRLRRAGIEPPPSTQAEPNRPMQAQAQLSNWLKSVSLRAQWLSPQPDRWGRWPVRLFAAGRDGQWMSVAEALVDAGLVRVAIDPLARPCLGELLQLEESARTAELGLWRDPDLKVLPADNRALLLTHVGRSVIIEGRVEGTGEGRTRLYVNFGRRRAMDFSAVLLRK